MTMSDHLSDEVLAAYLIDAASDEEIEIVETHVAACEPCAQRLVREAQLEEALREIAQRVTIVPRRATWRRWTGVGIALAAGLALWIGWPREVPREAVAPPERAVPVCERLPTHCERPTRHGLVATTPIERDAIPRYEDLAPAPMASEPLVPTDRNNL
jgi:hypothetical protein